MYRNIAIRLIVLCLIFISLTGCKKDRIPQKRDIKYNKFVESGGLKKDANQEQKKMVEKDLGI